MNSIAWAPWECGLILAAASSDKTISILKRKKNDTWDKLIRFQAHEQGVNSISWAPLTNLKDYASE